MEPKFIHKFEARPFGGSYLQIAVELDTVCPGHLRDAFHGPDLNRQVRYLVYAEILRGNEAPLVNNLRDAVGIVGESADAGRAVVCRSLTTIRARAIVKAIFKVVPDGFLGLLRRLGADPLPEPTLYRELHRLFSSHDPADRARALVLRQSPGAISPTQIAIVLALDPILLHPRFARKIETIDEARDFNAAFAYIRAHCSTATNDAIRQSVSAFPETKIVEAFMRRWARRFDRLPFPLELADPSLLVLDTGAALVDAGRRYDNCLATKVPEVLVGRYLYVEVRIGAGRGVIAELRRTSRCWVIQMLYQRGNGHVSQDIAAVVRRKLVAQGIAIYDRSANGITGLDAAAKLLDIYNWCIDDASEVDTSESYSLSEVGAVLDDSVHTFASPTFAAEPAV